MIAPDLPHNQSVQFSATLDKTPDEGGWHFIVFPPGLHDQLQSAAGKKGNVPVIATIGKTSFMTTTMSMGQQRWFFAVKAAVRQAEDLAQGDEVTVRVVPDFARIK